jgi:hypothetical protein
VNFYYEADVNVRIECALWEVFQVKCGFYNGFLKAEERIGSTKRMAIARCINDLSKESACPKLVNWVCSRKLKFADLSQKFSQSFYQMRFCTELRIPKEKCEQFEADFTESISEQEKLIQARIEEEKQQSEKMSKVDETEEHRLQTALDILKTQSRSEDVKPEKEKKKKKLARLEFDLVQKKRAQTNFLQFPRENGDLVRKINIPKSMRYFGPFEEQMQTIRTRLEIQKKVARTCGIKKAAKRSETLLNQAILEGKPKNRAALLKRNRLLKKSPNKTGYQSGSFTESLGKDDRAAILYNDLRHFLSNGGSSPCTIANMHYTLNALLKLSGMCRISIDQTILYMNSVSKYTIPGAKIKKFKRRYLISCFPL